MLFRSRGQQYVRDWLRGRCKALVARNEVRPRRDLLTVNDGEKIAVVPWDPCANL